MGGSDQYPYDGETPPRKDNEKKTRLTKQERTYSPKIRSVAAWWRLGSYREKPDCLDRYLLFRFILEVFLAQNENDLSSCECARACVCRKGSSFEIACATSIAEAAPFCSGASASLLFMRAQESLRVESFVRTFIVKNFAILYTRLCFSFFFFLILVREKPAKAAQIQFEARGSFANND